MENNNNIGSGPDKKLKSNPFSAPESYFESFPQRLQQRLQSDEPARLAEEKRFLPGLKPRLALVAAATALFIIGYLGFQNLMHQEDPWLTSEEIAGYIDMHHHEFTDYYFLGTLDDDLYEDEYYTDDALYEYDPDIYIEYLYHEDIDIELIIAEY